MKVLLVSDSLNDSEKIYSFLKTNGYDVIVYHWLLKALDNIEEISPDVTVISARDYPRHWKTLVQFEKSGITRNISDFILFVPENFSEDEKKKAEALGIKGFFNSVDERGLNSLLELLFVNKDISKLSFENRTLEKTEDSENENLSDEVPTVSDIVDKNEPVMTHIPVPEELKLKTNQTETVKPKKRGSLLARMQEMMNAE